MTDDTAALVARMKEAAGAWPQPALVTSVEVLRLIAAYEAEKERGDCAEQSEAELVQGEKDLDLQIDDLKHKLDDTCAERDALAELLRRSVVVIDSLAGTLEGMELGVTCVGARRLLADIKALLARANPPNLMRDADKAHKK